MIIARCHMDVEFMCDTSKSTKFDHFYTKCYINIQHNMIKKLSDLAH